MCCDRGAARGEPCGTSGKQPTHRVALCPAWSLGARISASYVSSSPVFITSLVQSLSRYLFISLNQHPTLPSEWWAHRSALARQSLSLRACAGSVPNFIARPDSYRAGNKVGTCLSHPPKPFLSSRQSCRVTSSLPVRAPPLPAPLREAMLMPARLSERMCRSS